MKRRVGVKGELLPIVVDKRDDEGFQIIQSQVLFAGVAANRSCFQLRNETLPSWSSNSCFHCFRPFSSGFIALVGEKD